MTRLDISFLGRGPDPLIVRSSKEIVREAKWSWPRFVLKVLAVVLMFLLSVSAVFLAVD